MHTFPWPERATQTWPDRVIWSGPLLIADPSHFQPFSRRVARDLTGRRGLAARPVTGAPPPPALGSDTAAVPVREVQHLGGGDRTGRDGQRQVGAALPGRAPDRASGGAGGLPAAAEGGEGERLLPG